MDIHKENSHMADYTTQSSYPPFTPYYSVPKKRKLVAGIFSFIFPGTGHFYLGLMQRGLFFMLLLILDIFTITALVGDHETRTSVPTVTLFALFIPVIYCYNLFDALQLTDRVNRRLELGDFAGHSSDIDMNDPVQKLMKGTNLGVILIVAGGLIFMLSHKPYWFSSLFNMLGSFAGSCILVLIGVAMFVMDSRKNK